jgi:prevent-host-death family protein
MTNKKVSFTAARENFSVLIDEVQRSGKPVTITKRGQPAAVLINCEVFEQRMSGKKQKRWKLRGSLTGPSHVDIDKAIREVRESLRDAWEERMARRGKEFAEGGEG